PPASPRPTAGASRLWIVLSAKLHRHVNGTGSRCQSSIKFSMLKSVASTSSVHNELTGFLQDCFLGSLRSGCHLRQVGKEDICSLVPFGQPCHAHYCRASRQAVCAVLADSPMPHASRRAPLPLTLPRKPQDKVIFAFLADNLVSGAAWLMLFRPRVWSRQHAFTAFAMADSKALFTATMASVSANRRRSRLSSYAAKKRGLAVPVCWQVLTAESASVFCRPTPKL
ncbi:hypothetical protein MAPG_08421, partial [Magnaporthiopsis poae ATCC 64411]